MVGTPLATKLTLNWLQSMRAFAAILDGSIFDQRWRSGAIAGAQDWSK